MSATHRILKTQFKLSQPKLVQHAVMESIEHAMWLGEIPVGSHIVEDDLAKSLQVSRSSVREALRQLQLKGLLRYEPYRGFFVVRWTRQDLEEVCSLRILLEGYSSRLAAARITGEELSTLEVAIDRMHEAAQANDFARLVQMDAGFHSLVGHYSGHRLLALQIENFSPHLRMFIALSKEYRIVYPDIHSIADSHAPLLDALRARDPLRAEAVASEHVREVGEAFLHAIS